MTMDLRNENGDHLNFNIFCWRKILTLAKQYGWEPTGTEKPPHWEDSENSWDGEYLTNEGQVVKAEDARAIAEALELALCDLHNSLAPEEWTEARSEEITDDPLIKVLMKKLGGLESNIEKEVLAATKTPLEFFRGEGEEGLRAFIWFCREGSFTIW